MPLPLTQLDTRRWDDLTAEGRALIPRYAPRWTDHNVHDPGITLVELLAWLVELDVYQLNRIPDAHRRKFLSLVGIQPEGPRPAQAMLGIAPLAPLDVPQAAEFVATTPENESLLYRAVESVRAFPLHLTALRVQPRADKPSQDYTRQWLEGGALAVFGSDPAVHATLWFGFDAPMPKNETVRLALAFAGDRHDAAERERILAEEQAAADACKGTLPPTWNCDNGATPASPSGNTDIEPLQHHSVRVAWEYYANGAWHALDADKGEVRDDTRALTLDGTIELRVPEDMTALDAGDGVPSFYGRVRMVEGDYDASPQLSSVVVNALRVEQAATQIQIYSIRQDAFLIGTVPPIPGPAHVQVRLDAQGAITQLEFVDDETSPFVEILFYLPPGASEDGVLVADFITVGESDGLPSLALALKSQVADGSVQVFSVEAGTSTMWAERADFDASNGKARDYILDAVQGEIDFGDGDKGHIPLADAWILARYRTTRASKGNLDAGKITTLAPTLGNWLRWDAADFQTQLGSLGIDAIRAQAPERVWSALSSTSYQAVVAQFEKIQQGKPGYGGAEQETLAHAAGRAVAMLSKTTRAVTASDYKELALETPGTMLARAHPLPGKHPSFPCASAPGVVTVIVVPAQSRARPVPSKGLLNRVQSYLNRRRILGTHVEVVAPRYVTVQVTATVQAYPGSNVARVQADVLSAIDAFLDPLTGGPAAIANPSASSVLAAPPPESSPLAPGVTLLTTSAPPPTQVLATASDEPGWTFGRDVFRSEMLQVIDGVQGVDHVVSLELSANGGEAQCGNICVGPIELVTPGQHTIEVTV